MNRDFHTCRRCNKVLPSESINGDRFNACPFCGLPLMIRVYPAASLSSQPSPESDASRDESQAGCFYHPGRPADTVCSGCGRFICTLCEVAFQSGCLCPACIRQGVDPKVAEETVRQHVRYDKIALYLATAPIIFWPLTVLTAPAATILAIGWRKRTVSLVANGRVRFVLALLFGLLQTAGWIVLLIYLLNWRLG